jgi:hypothetical protein
LLQYRNTSKIGILIRSTSYVAKLEAYIQHFSHHASAMLFADSHAASQRCVGVVTVAQQWLNATG